MAATAATVVAGVLEGLQLATQLSQAAAMVSQAVLQAQQTGQPVDWTKILGDADTAESDVLNAIDAAKAAGR